MGKRKVKSSNTSINNIKENDINNNHIQTRPSKDTSVDQEPKVNALNSKAREKLIKNIEQGRFDDP
jgi:hypothetical protein